MIWQYQAKKSFWVLSENLWRRIYPIGKSDANGVSFEPIIPVRELHDLALSLTKLDPEAERKAFYEDKDTDNF